MQPRQAHKIVHIDKLIVFGGNNLDGYLTFDPLIIEYGYFHLIYIFISIFNLN